MSELVSILIPAYNAAHWLPGTLQSALGQSWPRVEVIVVDDGSTDDTLSTARRFENRVVKIVTQPNMGAPAARNTALSLAQGEYIQWLDADDLLHPNKISEQMKVADKLTDPWVLLSGAFGTFYYRPERAVFTRTSLWQDLSPVDYFLTRFTENSYFQTDAWLVSRKLTELAGPWTDFHSPDDDGEYFCRVAMNSSGIRFVADARTYYRIANYDGVSQARSVRAQVALFESKAKCIRYLLSLENSSRTRTASVRLLQEWLPAFYFGPEDLLERVRGLARDLGGELHTPRVKWKYRPVEWLCGYEVAAKASVVLPRMKAIVARRWDQAMYKASAGVKSSSRRAETFLNAGAAR